MHNKLVRLILAFALALTLAACEDDGDEDFDGGNVEEEVQNEDGDD